MAHKKGEGSVKNGRDSQSKRLGVKFLVVKPLLPATSSFVSVAQFIILEKMLALVKIILCLHYLMVWLNLKKERTTEHLSQ